MNWNLSEMVRLFSGDKASRLLLKGKWGLEKEALRVDENGDLALTDHPVAFGDKLENPNITTDFSESQIEIITPPLDSIEESYDYLHQIQTFVEQSLDSELLWPLSMPGLLPEEEDIPLAQYNGSHSGNEKEIYRSGLALRYGKKMQMISGIHYNFSFHPDFWEHIRLKFSPTKEQSEFVNEAYFGFARNFLRYRWMLTYLFGASPVKNRDNKSDELVENCTFNKDWANLHSNATSYRMSNFGYETSQQKDVAVSFNNLKDYIRDLRKVLTTRVDAYSDLGVYNDGKQVQLNDFILQSENEYYSPVRFKQILKSGETQLSAFEQRGIKYMELRCFDLDPYEKLGINLEQLYFVQIFALFCLFEESHRMTPEEAQVASRNTQLTALEGRKNGLELENMDGSKITLKNWGGDILEKMREIAKLMDKAAGGTRYQKTIQMQSQKMDNSQLVPSAKILDSMQKNDFNHEEFGLVRAKENICVTEKEAMWAS